MRALTRFTGAMLLALVATTAQATPDARADAEIRHLIDFIATSGCTFIRNGDPHGAQDAASHLAMKYGRAKSRLSTSEQFIEHVASRSFFSGEPYRVQCGPAAAQPAGGWLSAELTQWRSARR